MIEARGQTGRVTFDGSVVIIYRDTFVARGTDGHRVTSIPLRSVSAVNYKPATTFRRGSIDFVVPGGIASSDNTVVFLSRQSQSFSELHAAVMAAWGQLR